VSRTTIIPGQHPGNPDVDPSETERWVSPRRVERDVDRAGSASAFPPARRFVTIYPGSAASEAARAQMLAAQEHDRRASDGFLSLLDPDPDREPVDDG
jgi:hypothetical protein